MQGSTCCDALWMLPYLDKTALLLYIRAVIFWKNAGIIKVWISEQFPEFLNIINEVKKVFLNGTH